MSAKVIADTGVLVALIDRRDDYYTWSVQMSMLYKSPFYTCDAVIAETAYMLNSTLGADGIIALMKMIENNTVRVDFDVSHHAKRIADLVRKYDSLRMDYADACIVVMTEQEKYHDCVVLTVDRKDFSVYRRHGRSQIPFVAPDF
jgi:predicted nucleic acid-binding protein